MRLGLAIVRGRSMRPTYTDGQRLVVAYGARVRPGRAHIVRLPPGPDGPRPLAIKRVTHQVPGGWWIESDNPRAGVDSWQVGPIPDADVLAVVLRPLPARWQPETG